MNEKQESIDTLLNLIDTLKEEIDRLKQETTDEKPQEYKRWRADKIGMYLHIRGGISKWRFDMRSRDDDESYAIGNYFETEPEAERVIAKLKAYQTVKDDAKGYRWTVGDRNCDSKNYYISYDTVGYLNVNNSPWSKDLGQVYFASKEDAEYSLRVHIKEWELLYDLDEEANDRNKV